MPAPILHFEYSLFSKLSKPAAGVLARGSSFIAGQIAELGFVGFAFSQNKNKSREHLNARNKAARSAEEVANLAEQESRQAVPTERLKAMREYASAAGGVKAKGK